VSHFKNHSSDNKGEREQPNNADGDGDGDGHPPRRE